MNKRYRAIDTNSLNGNPFPISIEFSIKNDFYRIYLMPISIEEMLDLLPFEKFLIFNLDHHEYDNLNAIPLEKVTKKYSSYSKRFDDETLLLSKLELTKLLNEISHYNFCLIDADEGITFDEVIEIIDLSEKWGEITVADEVKQNFFLSSHDDCYLYFETNDKNLALEIISLQIKTLVSTVSGCFPNKLIFNPNCLLTKSTFSIVIPQNNVEKEEEISWKIFEGTFKKYIYENNSLSSNSELVFSKTNNEIKIEKVRNLSTSD